MEISYQYDCHKNIQSHWYFTQAEIYFSKNILLTIYNSLILPHLNYGLLLWGIHLQDISVLQKKAIRVVTNNTYKSQTEPIFKEYLWIILC